MYGNGRGSTRDPVGHMDSRRPDWPRGIDRHIVQPDVAVFGQKDLQQAGIVRAMVRDLNFPVEVVLCPIVREPDGLAMSSRNRYLSPRDREVGLMLSKALFALRDAFKKGERRASALEAIGWRMLERVPGLGFVCDLNHFPVDQLPDYAALGPRITMLHISDSPLPELNHHRPIGLGKIDFQTYFKAFLEHGFDGLGILEIGGQPWSGGYGQDTDDALKDSLRRLTADLKA